MSFDFDAGSSGSEGPWIAWSARGSQDGTVPAKCFYIRDENGKSPIDAFANGVVMDIETMKTGWQKSDGILGQAPDWTWNDSISQFRPQPSDEHKRGLQIRCAIGQDKTATWEQAGAAAWNGFTGLVPALKEQPKPGMLPVVKLAGTRAQQFKRGSTVEPVLEVVKWVERPDCLKEGAAAGVDAGVQAATAAQATASAPEGAHW